MFVGITYFSIEGFREISRPSNDKLKRPMRLDFQRIWQLYENCNLTLNDKIEYAIILLTLVALV